MGQAAPACQVGDGQVPLLGVPGGCHVVVRDADDGAGLQGRLDTSADKQDMIRHRYGRSIWEIGHH